MTLQDFDFWGAGVLSFCIAATVCLLDLYLVTGDRIRCPVHPLYSAESRFFIVFNGLVGAVFYFLAMTKSQLLDGYQLPIGVKWGTENSWSKAVILGIFSVAFVRSNLLSLKDNRIIGLDVFYTRCRESCVDTLITATLVKQRRIIRQYRERFLEDKSFTKDFGEFILQKMEHSKAKPLDIKVLKETMSNSADDPEAMTVVHEALIKSALLCISRRNLKSILKNWAEQKIPVERLSFLESMWGGPNRSLW